MSNMILLTLILTFILSLGLYMIGKTEKWESSLYSIFECGFTSYFFSRFSFSIHYFMIGLIFLFLDLELCFIMPYFLEKISSELLFNKMNVILLILLLGLMFEWEEGKLDWKF